MFEASREIYTNPSSVIRPVIEGDGLTKVLADEPLIRPDGSSLVIWRVHRHATHDYVYDFRAGCGTSLYSAEVVKKAGEGSEKKGIGVIGNLFYKHAYYLESGTGVHEVLLRIQEMIVQLAKSKT